MGDLLFRTRYAAIYLMSTSVCLRGQLGLICDRRVPYLWASSRACKTPGFPFSSGIRKGSPASLSNHVYKLEVPSTPQFIPVESVILGSLWHFLRQSSVLGGIFRKHRPPVLSRWPCQLHARPTGSSGSQSGNSSRAFPRGCLQHPSLTGDVYSP